jgi:hypothetical protein
MTPPHNWTAEDETVGWGSHLPPAQGVSLPAQSGYTTRLRAAVPLITRLLRMRAIDTDPPGFFDSTPVERARFRPPSHLGRLRLLRLTKLLAWRGTSRCIRSTRNVA